MLPLRAAAFVVGLALVLPIAAADSKPLRVMFLGDNGHHKPAERFQQLEPVLAKRGIELVYTDSADSLNPKTLGQFDALVVYANTTKINPEQEKALLDFVEGGKGFVPLHCASYCFLNSPKYIALVGAQFQKHGTGTFRTTAVAPDHPIMRGFGGFESWDETYVHTKHNDKDRTVLEVRADGDKREPWTWVRTQGKGRVFYTAWGHDQRTWGHPGFHNLVERGIRWAVGQDPAAAGPYFDRPQMTEPRKDVKPFEYQEATVPLYLKGVRGGGDRQNKMQKPLSTEESIKHFVTPKDFEVRTFVTEEKLGGKPLAMAWDERGRLWVSITRDYPNELQRSGEGRDRIVVCEDADGDGVCDTVTTFADKLSIPTSLLPYAGGVIVHQAPVTLFLKDTDGDGKADVRQELFRGWSTGDTHAGPSNLHYGFDNWVYGSVGYAGFNGTVGGEQLNFRQGFYRFKVEANGRRQPAGGDGKDQPADAGRSPLKITKLEFLRSTSNNTWGLAFDEAGQLFGSTANGCPLVQMPVPNRYYEKVKGLTPTVLPNIAADYHFEPITNKVRQVDWHGGFTAASNCAIYTARTYPPEYWNRTAFVSEPTGHLTAAFTLQPQGATFSARYGWNLLASDDEWSAPIDAQVGPDGHVWVIDWYNYIVQHNPTPAGFKTGKGAAYETPLRDKTHGRIYRVVYTKAKPEPRVDLKDATPEKLVETLRHHNLTWRLHAQRLLVERGKWDVSEPLLAVLGDRTGDGAATVHAIGTFDGLGLGAWPRDLLKEGQGERLKAYQQARGKVINALRNAVRHPSASVRRIALGVLGTVHDLPAANEMVTPGVADPDPAVRLAALLALADRGLHIERVGSRNIERGESGTIASKPIVQALKRSDNVDEPNIRVALTVAATAHAGSVLVTLSADRFPAAALPIIEAASAAAVRRPSGGDHIAMMFGALIEADPAVRDAIAAGFASGWPADDRPALTPADEQVIGKALAKVTPRSRAKLIKLVSTWGITGLDAQLAEITKGLFATVADVKADAADRIAAAKQAIEFQPDSDATASALLAAVTPQTPPAVAAGIFDALAASKSKAVGVAVVAKLKDLPPAVRTAALRLVLAKPEAAAAFLDAVEKGTLRFDLLALDQKTALASSPDKAVAERARKLLAQGGGLPDPDRQKVIDQLMPVVKKTGDPAAGKKVFVQHCAKCHKHGGEGQQIGPDLTGMATHPKEELLIAVLDPSRSVEGNYKAYAARTLDGRVITGLLAAETKTSVEMIDAENKRHAISRDDLEDLRELPKSLMPEGFEKQMTAAELTDMLEFLTQKGKFVPLPLEKVVTASSGRGMFNDENSPVERLMFPDAKGRTVEGVPFDLTSPRSGRLKNVILLNGPRGVLPPKMPKSVALPCNTPVKAIHMLGGVSGWGFPATNGKTVSLIVRLYYAGGKTEDHELVNGVHIADYIRRVDVPGSRFAFAAEGGQQVRYLAVFPKEKEKVERIELVKGKDATAPVVVAVTLELPE